MPRCGKKVISKLVNGVSVGIQCIGLAGVGVPVKEDFRVRFSDSAQHKKVPNQRKLHLTV